MLRRLLLGACALALVSCGGKASAPELPYPRSEVGFFMSSLATRYAFRGEFWGSTLITPTAVEVRVDSTTVRRPSEKLRPRSTVWIRAALAVRTRSAWRIIARSDPIEILDDSPAGSSVKPPLRFSISKPRDLDPERHYLTFEFAFESRRGPGEAPGIATTYVCGVPGMLREMVAITHTPEEMC